MADPTPAKKFVEGLQMGPLGLPVNVTSEDPGGLGDRSSILGDTSYIPSRDPASVPHENMHGNVRQLEQILAGGAGPLAEGLLSAGAEKAYGDQSQYLNPFERLAYGYQEGKTGQPDTGYDKAVAAPHSGGVMTLKAVMNLLGGGADFAGRALGKLQR